MNEINLFESRSKSVLKEEGKRIVEAALFASHEPVEVERLREVLEELCDFKPREILQMLQELESEYRDHAFELVQIGEGWMVRTRERFGPYLQVLHGQRKVDRLSKAALEILAIVAYRQPITRPKMEALRGVDCSGTLQALQERGFVEVKGRAEGPGRPSLFGTTEKFLRYFDLKSLDELPPAPVISSHA